MCAFVRVNTQSHLANVAKTTHPNKPGVSFPDMHSPTQQQPTSRASCIADSLKWRARGETGLPSPSSPASSPAATAAAYGEAAAEVSGESTAAAMEGDVRPQRKPGELESDISSSSEAFGPWLTTLRDARVLQPAMGSGCFELWEG